MLIFHLKIPKNLKLTVVPTCGWLEDSVCQGLDAMLGGMVRGKRDKGVVRDVIQHAIEAPAVGVGVHHNKFAIVTNRTLLQNFVRV